MRQDETAREVSTYLAYITVEMTVQSSVESSLSKRDGLLNSCPKCYFYTCKYYT